ncbi:hypothetical protein BJ508DRAFT_380691 [Ascobolus immersus RN42]|uniref:Uncharacterized protein n=1 Tax=Ascobolus immersus RN42 TaxID=1160509 RepID=A0A3N4HKD9_ASCIM|nr:hypothetical protein BJ508DRAFT_380691 [Ascobolus immersus RN42]
MSGLRFTRSNFPVFASEKLQLQMEDDLQRSRKLNPTLSRYVIAHLRPRPKFLDDIPTNIEEFVRFLRKVLSDHLVDLVRNGLKQFDRLIDDEKDLLGNQFIKEYTYVEWITLMLDSLDVAFAYASAPESKPRLLGGSNVVTGTGIEIIQVELTGPNLKAAWLENETIAGIRSSQPPRDFNPLTPNAFPVYHGSALPLSSPALVNPFIETGPTIGFCNDKNQIVPRKAIYTSYWMLRCIAWAAFKSHVCDFSMFPSTLNTFDVGWHYRGTRYKGVMIWEYNLSCPPPAGLTQEAIPQELVQGWHDYCGQSRSLCQSSEGLNDVWAAGQQRHGSSLETWPDLLHAPESRTTRNASLRPIIGPGCLEIPATRTAFATAAGEAHLRSTITNRRYAVSFTLAEAKKEEAIVEGKQSLRKKISEDFKDKASRLHKRMSNLSLRSSKK